jgi:hypothetical protein
VSQEVDVVTSGEFVGKYDPGHADPAKPMAYPADQLLRHLVSSFPSCGGVPYGQLHIMNEMLFLAS